MRPPPSAWPGIVLATGVAIVLVAACGSPARLDVERSEARIRTSLARAYRLEVTAVRCPEDIPVEQGATFTCAASVEGARVRVEVLQRDGEGALRVEPVAAVIVTSALIDDVQKVLADRFERTDAAVSCPGPAVRVVAPGAVIRCSAVDGTERKMIAVRVRDVSGSLTYTLR